MKGPVFGLLFFVVSIVAGAVAAVTGFGIGSLLTPVAALKVGTKTAVAAVSIPHLAGTAVRFWLLRSKIDRSLLWRFGLMSAVGGLAGALLNAWASSRALAMVFGVLLVFAGASQLSGYAERWRFRGAAAWMAGALSGLFGGLVGNQGGIRSAAMLGFDVPKERFVATATAVALVVDAARVPVYAATEGELVVAIWQLVVIAGAGAIVGTFVGQRLLAIVPERRFRQIVGTVILLLGAAVLIRGRA